MSSDALHEPRRILVQKQPLETPRQAAERYIRGISRRGYYMWDDSPTLFYTWIPGVFDNTIEVIY